jgi:membrane peptidoglycan carboxypeptidase
MRSRDHNMFTNGASLIVCGVLAGVVVAAAAFPAVAMSGLAAKAGAVAFDKLPSELTVKRSPQITYVYAADRKTLVTTLYDENRRDVKLADVAPIMQKAMLAAEDQRFYEHNGVDPQGIARAFVANRQAGTVSQGASTITMQYVRLAISYSATTPQQVVDATEDTNVRKLREMRYALAVEKKLSKDEILERYLNIAAFGNGAFGIYAASQVYFGKHPKDLKLAEAAMLAGLVKAPTSFNPADPDNLGAARERRNWVLDQMLTTNAATPAEVEAARTSEIKITGTRTPNGCVSVLKNDWGFLCDFLYRWWLEQEAFGATPYERENRLKTGGYVIYSSLDVTTQKAAKDNVEQRLPTIKKTKQPESAALMLAAVEPGTGKIRALATNRYYRLDDRGKPQNGLNTDPAKKRLGIHGTYPNTTNPLITGGGDITGYQAGSVFKIFTLVAALEAGLPLAYVINAEPIYKSNYPVDSKSEAACPGTTRYCPVNANASMAGPRNMWTGFGMSVNTFFVPLQEQIGTEKAVDAAKRLGMQFRAHGTPTNPSDYEFANNPALTHSWGPFTLGVSGATPLDLANAFATLSADGKYCEPIPVEEIKDVNGNKLDVGNPRCRQSVRTEVARAAIDAARCPIGDQSAFKECAGTTYRAGKSVVGKWPLAGKTGTTDNNRTASLTMTTKQLAVSGIIADPDWAQTTRDFTHAEVNPTVAETMHDAMQGKPSIPFTPPPRELAYGTQVSIPNVTCQDPAAAQNTLRRAGFRVSIEKDPVPSACPPGTVAKTSPSGRTVKNSAVVIYISAGGGAPSPGPGGGGGGGPGRGGGGGGGGGGTLPIDPCRVTPGICPPPRT